MLDLEFFIMWYDTENYCTLDIIMTEKAKVNTLYLMLKREGSFRENDWS